MEKWTVLDNTTCMVRLNRGLLQCQPLDELSTTVRFCKTKLNQKFYIPDLPDILGCWHSISQFCDNWRNWFKWNFRYPLMQENLFPSSPYKHRVWVTMVTYQLRQLTLDHTRWLIMASLGPVTGRYPFQSEHGWFFGHQISEMLLLAATSWYNRSACWPRISEGVYNTGYRSISGTVSACDSSAASSRSGETDCTATREKRHKTAACQE